VSRALDVNGEGDPGEACGGSCVGELLEGLGHPHRHLGEEAEDPVDGAGVEASGDRGMVAAEIAAVVGEVADRIEVRVPRVGRHRCRLPSVSPVGRVLRRSIAPITALRI
jgi:hypothetical protein